MLVVTRKTNEVTVIDNRIIAVTTEILPERITLHVHGPEPFDAWPEYLSKGHRPDYRTSFEFVLAVGEAVIIDSDITIIFIVARTGAGHLEPNARIGFEGPPRTNLCCRDATGFVVKEFELGAKVPSG